MTYLENLVLASNKTRRQIHVIDTIYFNKKI